MRSNGNWNDENDGAQPFVCSSTTSTGSAPKDNLYLSYDLWRFYVSDDPDEVGDEERITHSIVRGYSWDCYDDVCEATSWAWWTTWLALLFTAFGALGLVNYQQCPDEDRAKKRFGRCSVLLALGGLSGLVGAVAYRSLIAAAALKLDATGNEGTNTCAAGCALSLSFGLIAMVTGAAAVFLQQKYAKVPAGERQGSVKSIHMRTGDLVDQVQFEYRSGLSRTWGRGGGGGRPSFHLQDDEYLYSIEYCQNNTNLFGICFETNKGRKSQWYGNRSRSSSTLHAAAGQMFVGLKRGGGFCEKIKGIEEEPLEAPAAPLAEEEA